MMFLFVSQCNTLAYRLKFPSVLVLYQDIIVCVHGINVLIGFADRKLFCSSEDLAETLYSATASPYCTVSGIKNNTIILCLTLVC